MTGIIARLEDHLPHQRGILEHLVEVFSATRQVDSAWLREASDERANELSLVLIIDDKDFPAFLEGLDALVKRSCSPLLPGWHDRQAMDFGGASFVYLLQMSDQLSFVRLTLTPRSRRERLRALPELRQLFQTVYRNSGAPSLASFEDRVKPGIDLALKQLSHRDWELHHQLIELLTLATMIKKAWDEEERFVVYAHTHQLFTCVRNLICLAFDAAIARQGWAALEGSFSQNPTVRTWLLRFESLVFASPLLSEESLLEVIAFALELIHERKPGAIAELEYGAESVTQHLDPAGRRLSIFGQSMRA
jgi:hypothetical protein